MWIWASGGWPPAFGRDRASQDRCSTRRYSPGLAANLLQVGEEAGDLETMLLRVAEIYDRDVQTKIKRTVDILGPLLILVLAVLIGAIIMSVLVALLGVNELAF